MDDEPEYEMNYDPKTGDVTAFGPKGGFQPLGRVAEVDGGWLSWDSTGKQVLDRPRRGIATALKSLVVWNGLGSVEYEITTG